MHSLNLQQEGTNALQHCAVLLNSIQHCRCSVDNVRKSSTQNTNSVNFDHFNYSVFIFINVSVSKEGEMRSGARSETFT